MLPKDQRRRRPAIIPPRPARARVAGAGNGRVDAQVVVAELNARSVGAGRAADAPDQAPAGRCSSRRRCWADPGGRQLHAVPGVGDEVRVVSQSSCRSGATIYAHNAGARWQPTRCRRCRCPTPFREQDPTRRCRCSNARDSHSSSDDVAVKSRRSRRVPTVPAMLTHR